MSANENLWQSLGINSTTRAGDRWHRCRLRSAVAPGVTESHPFRAGNGHEPLPALSLEAGDALKPLLEYQHVQIEVPRC